VGIKYKTLAAPTGVGVIPIGATAANPIPTNLVIYWIAGPENIAKNYQLFVQLGGKNPIFPISAQVQNYLVYKADGTTENNTDANKFYANVLITSLATDIGTATGPTDAMAAGGRIGVRAVPSNYDYNTLPSEITWFNF
jgi:hypothetical protein